MVEKTKLKVTNKGSFVLQIIMIIIWLVIAIWTAITVSPLDPNAGYMEGDSIPYQIGVPTALAVWFIVFALALYERKERLTAEANHLHEMQEIGRRVEHIQSIFDQNNMKEGQH